jgi:hypothetical protein
MAASRGKAAALPTTRTAADIVADMAVFLGQIAALALLPPPRSAVVDMAVFFGKIGGLHASHKARSAPARFVSTASVSEFLQTMVALPASAGRPTPTFDIWKVISLGRSEVRTTSILAWAMDPCGSHGKCADVLNALLNDVRPKEDSSFPFPRWIEKCEVSTEEWYYEGQASRVDIVVEGSDFTTFVEVKVDAPPIVEQVKRYLMVSEARAKATGRARFGVMFLAPKRASSLPDLGPHVVSITWSDVARAVRSCIPQAQNSMASAIDVVLGQFAAHVERF